MERGEIIAMRASTPAVSIPSAADAQAATACRRIARTTDISGRDLKRLTLPDACVSVSTIESRQG